ncbi:MAG: hypothetical protein JNL98_04430 [Bryobacterales bacterium]|nr:hypothetical protein [Bryobacterales bacterium]
MEPRICPYCQQPFTPSRYRPGQRICSSKPCQDRRKAESQRARKAADPVYAEVCRDAQRQWREANPDYQRQYRATHPDAAERNRQQQRLRDERRKISNLVKNNLAFDLTSSVSNIFLVGPAAAQLDKNNLAQSKLLIFHNLQAAASPSLRS